MNLFQKMAGFMRSLTVREPDGWQPTGNTSDSGELVNDNSALALSAVWGCVNLMAGTTATLPMAIYKSTGDSRSIWRSHPLHRLLHDSPNYDQTAVDFWEFLSVSLELWGNAYALISRTGERIVALDPIRPEAMSVRRTFSGDIEYSWADGGKTFRKLSSEVWHIRGFGGNALGGMSTLRYGRNTFGLSRSVDKAASSTFKNGMRPSGALSFNEFLSSENRAIAEDRLTEKFVGAANAGRPMILEGGASWQPFAIKPEDAQMLESRKFSVEDICRWFGVPPHMIGHTEKSSSWGTGLEQQTLAFQKFSLRRRLRRIEQSIVKQLMSPSDRANGCTAEFNLEGLLRGDSKSRSDFYSSGLNNGWMTINEVRRRENLPPVDGGDVPRMQMQNIPITETQTNAD